MRRWRALRFRRTRTISTAARASNFDYGLAPGVIKTYKKRYALNYERVAEILCPEAGITEKGMRALIQKIQEEQGVYPNLDENP